MFIMPARAFHLNMQNYGGGTPGINALFDADLTAINAITGAVYWVAGFTEIRNNNTAQNFFMRAGNLDGGFDDFILIAVGRTAVGNTIEHLGVTWDSAHVNVTNAGQVLYDAQNKNWVCFNRAIGAVAPPTIALPNLKDANLAADSRGLAYVAGAAGGVNHVFAFMHNVYTIGNKSGAYSNLDLMALKILDAVGWSFGNADVYIGGDFNVYPHRPNGQRSVLADFKAVDGMGLPLNTTNANPYDFWLTNDATRTNNNARRYTQPLVSGASDHSAITLRIV
jgi:hypothetical protein